MTYKQNITAILECCFAGFKEEIIDSACNRILEQKPKTGHWEYVQYDYNPRLGNWHCSECRCVVIECVDKNEKGGIPLYKYCPQCGAKMESEDKE